MNSILQLFRPPGRVFAVLIRVRRRPETGGSTSHPASQPTTDSPGSRLLSEAGDAFEFVSPLLQALADAVPVAGSPLKAAVGGLLSVIQIIDTKKRNKAALLDLAERVHQLIEFLSPEPPPRDDAQVRRRAALARRLRNTSCKLEEMQKRRSFKLAYKSMTQDIDECDKAIERFLSESTFYNTVSTDRRLILIESVLWQIPGSPLHCAILIDAVGHKHNVPLESCRSFQQLKDILPELIKPELRGASVQRRYITSGKFDLCIDDGRKVTQLTSSPNGWPNIEAGTTIVMRVIFERRAFFAGTYECHLCGARNEIVACSNSSGWLTDGSLDCHNCKRRFQISLDRGRKTEGGNNLIDPETQQCIYNFRVTQTEAWQSDIGISVEPPSPSDSPRVFLLPMAGQRNRTATTSCHDPNGSFTISRSQSEVASHETGPIVQQLATLSRLFGDDTSEDDRFEECDDELEELGLI